MRARVMIRPEQMYRQTDGQTQTKGTLGWRAVDRILVVWEERYIEMARVFVMTDYRCDMCVWYSRYTITPLKGNI
jgi:hypothetical protein